jgi:predicted RNA binding protein YcfA (HicA-like mRNA interferase family)
MAVLPMLTAREVIRALERAGFRVQRQTGSHVRLTHTDGRVVTVPIHAGQNIGRGLLRKILRDADLTREEFATYLALHEEIVAYEINVTLPDP